MPGRRITVNGVAYTWILGRGTVHVRRDNKSVLSVPTHEVAGVTPLEWERAAWKGYGMITPKHIRNIILERLGEQDVRICRV